MRATPLVWMLRGLAVLYVLGLLTSLFRTLRAHRAAQFKARPSTAQGLAGRFLPDVSAVVPSPDGAVGGWVSRLAYPRLEVVVAAPADAAVRGAPPGAVVVRARGAAPGELLQAATAAATGDVVVVLPSGMAVGPGFVKRLVAPLVDPFVGVCVPRVMQARPGGGLAARVDDIERLARTGVQLGRHVTGAPVTCDREPFAVRRQQLEDVGGCNPAQLAPDTDVALRLYVRGFAVAYVEEAVALAPPPGWEGLSAHVLDRTAGLRRLWRALRRPLRRGKVLEGPEKTDVRWTTRGAAAPLWLLAGWVLDGALRLADTSWAPEAIGGILVLATFSTLGLIPFVQLSAAAVQTRRRTMLTLGPWLAPLSLGTMWTGAGAALASPFRRTGVRAQASPPAAVPAPARARPARPRRRRPEPPRPRREPATVAEEPVAEEPVAEEPVAEEPVAEEPVAEEPVAEEPVAEEPVAEARGLDEAPFEVAAPPEPAAQEPEIEVRAPEGPAPAPRKRGRKVKAPATSDDSLWESR